MSRNWIKNRKKRYYACCDDGSWGRGDHGRQRRRRGRLEHAQERGCDWRTGARKRRDEIKKKRATMGVSGEPERYKPWLLLWFSLAAACGSWQPDSICIMPSLSRRRSAVDVAVVIRPCATMRAVVKPLASFYYYFLSEMQAFREPRPGIFFAPNTAIQVPTSLRRHHAVKVQPLNG